MQAVAFLAARVQFTCDLETCEGAPESSLPPRVEIAAVVRSVAEHGEALEAAK